MAAFILLALWCFSHRRVDHSLAALGLYLGLLDGYVKLRTGSPLVTLGRDVLVAAIAGGALLRSLSSRQPLPLPPLGGLVLGFAAVVMIEMFNPSAPGSIQSLAGVRQHLEFVPLFFLGFAFIRHESQVRTLAMILVICAAAGGVVSLVQSLLTPEQLAQWGPGYRERIYGTGAFTGAGRVALDAAGNAAVRPFGLGSEAGGGASAAALALPALIALVMNAGRRFPLIYLPLAVGIALAVVTSGSRAATVAVVLSVVAFAVIAAVSRNAVRVMVGLAIASVLIVAVFQQVSPGNAAKNRVESVTPSKISSTFSQERGSTLKTFGRYAQAYPLGVGIGTVGPAAAVSGERNTAVLDAETLWNFLIIETGLPGLALIVALLLRMMWIALVRIRHSPDPKMRLYLAALAAPLFGLAAAGFAGPTTISVPSAPFLWFVAGILSYWLMRRPDSHGRPPPALVQARGYREPPMRPLPAHVA
ncbi:MAG: O-antigen ligase family protein [Solirubrobacteraceae bacterium]